MSKKRLGKLTLQKDIFDTAIKDNLKSTVDITALFAHFGVKLTKKGKSYIGLCPWHNEKTPSLSVDKTKGLYNCFGCGESGDIFTLTEKMKGISFSESLEYLQAFQKNVPILSASLPQEKQAQQNKPVVANKTSKAKPKEQAVVKKTKRETALSDTVLTYNSVADYYHKQLANNKEARAYLNSRGISNTVINTFNLGFSKGTLLAVVGDTQKENLKNLHLVTAQNREFFNNCIVVPLVDGNGQTLSFYGRTVGERSRTNHLYMPGEHKTVFNEKAYKVYDELILTESLIDALSLLSVGVHNVSCIYGTQGLTKLHLEKLKEHTVKTVVLALDNDDAGRKAVEKQKELLVAEGFTVKVIFPTGVTLSGVEGKDWNDDLVHGTLEKDSLIETIANLSVHKNSASNSRNFRRTNDGLVLQHDDITYTEPALKKRTGS